MKGTLGAINALYLTPAVLVGATVNGKPNLGVSLVYDSRTALFLMQLKEAIARRHYIVTQREKNNGALARRGMSPQEREEVLWGLEAHDYCWGPEMDPEHPDELGVWEFTTKYRGIDMCIKIRLLQGEDGFYAKCLSFHE